MILKTKGININSFNIKCFKVKEGNIEAEESVYSLSRYAITLIMRQDK